MLLMFLTVSHGFHDYSGNGSKNHGYRGDRALKFATGGYFEVNFSFLRVRE